MIHRHFWGWDKPVLERATEHLMQGWAGGELDLSSTLIVVPTTEAGRRLREALARATSAAAGAVTAPHVWSPEMALFPAQDRPHAASVMQTRLAWVRVLQDVDLAQFQAVFPVPPERKSWGWAMSTAQMLHDLLATLGAGGHCFASVAGQPAVQQDEERWAELARLEGLYLQALHAVSRQDVQQLKLRRAQSPTWAAEVQQILVMAVLDAPPLFGQWLANAAEQLPVKVCVQAPPELAGAFDAWGRPLPAFWLEAGQLLAPVPLGHMQVAQNATQQAALLIAALRALVPQRRTAVGVCDAEVIACVKDRLALEGVRVFEPGGVPPQSLGLWHILQTVKDLVATDSWRAFATMLRVPELRQMLAGDQSQQTLKEADAFAAKHLPVTLRHALGLRPRPSGAEQPERRPPSTRRPQRADPAQLELGLTPTATDPLTQALKVAQNLVAQFEQNPLHTAIRSLLLQLYGERYFTPSAPQDRSLLELADAAMDLATELAREVRSFSLSPSSGELFSLLLAELGGTMVTEPRGEVDLVLQGWLELLWESSPQLVVAGFNEEHVPGILLSHPFLPDSLRTALGLPCQASRYARDASLLHSLAAQRPAGALKVICGQWGERGEALKPSRLLMRGTAEELPQQVRLLFPSDESMAPPDQPIRSLAWQLRPRLVPQSALDKISISQLNSYLKCPFRYYLTEVLRMRPVAADKQEMDAGEFGSLIHHALEHLAKDEIMSASADEQAIRSFLSAAVKHRAHQLYGERLPVMVEIQVHSAIQRLEAAASIEAEQRANGWRILRSEMVLSDVADQQALVLEGVRVTGKVDRLEQRAGVELRVLDFKTSDEAKGPKSVHLKQLKGKARLRPEEAWQTFDLGDATYQWLDLQLPLYAAAVAKQGFSGASVAYLTLPKSVQDTQLKEWEDFGPDVVQSAMECAAEAIRRIKDGIFWPPNPRVKYDPYAELLLGDAKRAVDASALGSVAVEQQA
jgi:ATP-dependent helicase/nuclease subunit B